MRALDDNPHGSEHGRVFRETAAESRQGTRLVAILDLDIAAESLANRELGAALSAGVPEVVVDVSSVFVDVRGLSVLLIAARRARILGTRFAVVASPSLRTICRAVPIDSQLVLLDGPFDNTTKDTAQP